MSNPDQSPAVDERAAFIRWLCESFPAAWTERSAAHAWDNNESAVSAWHSAREPLLEAIAELKSRVAPTEAAAMAATVPAGYVLVPTVPTEAMIQAGACEDTTTTDSYQGEVEVSIGNGAALRVYSEMLKAAPQAPVADQPAEPSPADRVPELVEEMAVASDPIAKLNHALVEVHGAIAVVYVDFGTKWFTITSIGTDHEDIPNVGLEVSETAPDVAVSLPGRKGWRIVSASASKYSLTVVLKAPEAAPKGDSNG